jgi:RNA polymerase sigma-70 factor (ECF subfamily)
MSRLEHRTNDEIATLLHIKKKTVENHLNLALKELRTALPASLFIFITFFQ